MEVFSWIVAGLSLLGVWLNIKKNKICFVIWSGTNFSWAVIDFCNGIYAQAALFTIYFLLAVYGLVEWGRQDKKKEESK